MFHTPMGDEKIGNFSQRVLRGPKIAYLKLQQGFIRRKKTS